MSVVHPFVTDLNSFDAIQFVCYLLANIDTHTVADYFIFSIYFAALDV